MEFEYGIRMKTGSGVCTSNRTSCPQPSPSTLPTGCDCSQKLKVAKGAKEGPIVTREMHGYGQPVRHSAQRPRPPSTSKICPVMKWGAVVKNKIAALMSSAVLLRRMGV